MGDKKILAKASVTMVENPDTSTNVLIETYFNPKSDTFEVSILHMHLSKLLRKLEEYCEFDMSIEKDNRKN